MMEGSRPNIIFRIFRKSRFLFSYVRSVLMGWCLKKEFKDVQRFCLFIGYPRSGHSLVAALLDAHPEIVIGMEWDVMFHLRMGYQRGQVFYSILHNSKMFRKKKRNIWTGYSYQVEGLWQGDYTKISIIGDKKGGRTSMMLKEDPRILESLQKKLRVPILLIHVIRNPFDTITTMLRRSLEEKGQWRENIEADQLRPVITTFFDRARVNDALRKDPAYKVLDVYHEDFIPDPRAQLARIITFFGLGADDNYLERCAAIVFDKPHQSRNSIKWTEEWIAEVDNEIRNFDFLKRYNFYS
jgi:hypothetical protein